MKGGGPQKFKLQKCIKWRIVRLQACWWSECAFPLRRPSQQQRAWRFLTFPSRDAPGPEGFAAPLAPGPVSPGPRAGVAGLDSARVQRGARRPSLLQLTCGDPAAVGAGAGTEQPSRQTVLSSGVPHLLQGNQGYPGACPRDQHHHTPTPSRATGMQQTQGRFFAGAAGAARVPLAQRGRESDGGMNE